MRSLALIAAVALSACTSHSKPVDGGTPAPPVRRTRLDPTDRDFVLPPLRHARVVLTGGDGTKHLVDVEVAETPESTTRGLMWRTQLPEGTGMLFIFEGESVPSFWMKNCFIPIDMVFISAARRVVGTVSRAEPHTTTGRHVDGASQYVLELPGGWAEKIGLRPGTLVEFEGV